MATPLAPANVYGHWRNTKVYWSDGISDISSVSRAELTTSTDLSCEVTSIIGWEIASQVITDPQWGVFDAQRPGRTVVDPAQLLLKADRAGTDIRSLLSRGTAGWVLILPSGDVENHPMNVYPVTVAMVSQPMRVRGAANVLVTFAVTGEPAADVPIPAAS